MKPDRVYKVSIELEITRPHVEAHGDVADGQVCVWEDNRENASGQIRRMLGVSISSGAAPDAQDGYLSAKAQLTLVQARILRNVLDEEIHKSEQMEKFPRW